MHAAIVATSLLFLGQSDFDAGEFKLPPISVENGKGAGDFNLQTPPADNGAAKSSGAAGASFTIPPVDFGAPKQPAANPTGDLKIPGAGPSRPLPPLNLDSQTPQTKAAPEFSPAGPLSGNTSTTPPKTAPRSNLGLQTVAPDQPIDLRSSGTTGIATPPGNRSLSVGEQIMNRVFDADVPATEWDLRLQSIVQASSDPTIRLQNIQAYWTLAAAKADAAFARNELASLDRLPRTVGELDRAMIEAARSNAKARVIEADLALSAARAAIPMVVTDGRQPEYDARDALFAGRYNTRLNEMFRNQTPPAEVVRLDSSLTQMKALMDARANAVIANEKAFEQFTRTNMAAGGAASLVKQFERMRDARLAFLSRVRDYNFLIAKYALRVGGPSVTTGNVLSMLIGPPRQNRTILFGDSAVQTASATSLGSPRSSRIPSQVAPNARQDRSVLLQPAPTQGQPIFLGP